MMILDIEQSLSLPHKKENQGVNKLLRASLRRKGRTGEATDNQQALLPWKADFFLLNQCRFFQALSEEKKNTILMHCNDFMIGNSYFIEKAGLAYSAKMILLAESTEIRQIYGLIASDEAIHLEWLTPYVKESMRSSPQGKFIQLISSMIEQCDANSLYYLVQTLLEGWGIFYYKTLSIACQKSDLQQTLLNIVKDEALHHQTGVALFEPSKMDKTCEQRVFDGVLGYIDNLKSGPQDIVQCIENAMGETLSPKELALIFEELQTEQAARIKLNIFRGILHQPFIENFIASIELKGFFKPYSPEECAKIYCTNRLSHA